MADTELVFVYGTLRRHASNAFRMEGGTWEGMRTVRGRLYQISWYPGLKLSADAGRVIGEIWSVSPEQLLALDEFEGVPAGELEGDEYRRVRVTVEPLPDLENQSEWDVSDRDLAAREAWVWEWKGDPGQAQLIPSGDWLDLEAPKQKPLFTTIGCLSVLAFTVGTQALITGLGSLFPSFKISPGLGQWITFGALILAVLVGGYSLVMASRRREPGHTFQSLTGLALTVFTFMIVINLLITLFTRLFG